MKQYILIQNEGEIDINAFFIMGVTSKSENDRTIGQFGTGTKYGIAALMREGYDVVIFSGLKKIEFKKSKIKFRDQEYEKIMYRTGTKYKDTGITVEMGRLNWDAPRGFREIVSNAIDEGGFSINTVKEIDDGLEGTTRVFIEYKEGMKRLDENFDKFFLINRSPVFETSQCIAYKKIGDGLRVYRKGVLVFENEHAQSEYDYDFKNVLVGEDRTTSAYQSQVALSESIHEFPIENMKKIVKRFSSYDNIEGNLVPMWTKLNIEWKSLFDGPILTEEEYIIISKFMGNAIGNFNIVTKDILEVLKPLGLKRAKDIIDTGVLVGWEVAESDEFDERILSDAILFLQQAKIKISREEIIVANNPNGVCAGQYLDGKIYIDKSSIENGVDDTIDTLFEEAMHRDSGAADQSLAFQNFLKKKCLYYMRGFIIAGRMA